MSSLACVWLCFKNCLHIANNDTKTLSPKESKGLATKGAKEDQKGVWIVKIAWFGGKEMSKTIGYCLVINSDARDDSDQYKKLTLPYAL